TFPFVTECAHNAVSILEHADEGAFHVHSDALMNAVILKGADHLQARAIADVGQSWIFVSPEVSLQDLSIFSSIEYRAPRFQFATAGRCFLGMELGHTLFVDVLAAAHLFGEMDFPFISAVGGAQRSGNAAFNHHGVGLP